MGGVTEKDEFARFFNGVPLNIAQRGKNRCRAATRRTSVVPSDHDFFFCQLKRKSVNQASRQIAAVSFGEICVSIFYFLRKQNRAFAPAHPICRKALAGKVNAARVLAVCPEKARRRGKTPRLAALLRARGVVLQSRKFLSSA